MKHIKSWKLFESEIDFNEPDDIEIYDLDSKNNTISNEDCIDFEVNQLEVNDIIHRIRVDIDSNEFNWYKNENNKPGCRGAFGIKQYPFEYMVVSVGDDQIELIEI
jgi:hypothetical protein